MTKEKLLEIEHDMLYSALDWMWDAEKAIEVYRYVDAVTTHTNRIIKALEEEVKG